MKEEKIWSILLYSDQQCNRSPKSVVESIGGGGDRVRRQQKESEKS